MEGNVWQLLVPFMGKLMVTEHDIGCAGRAVGLNPVSGMEKNPNASVKALGLPMSMPLHLTLTGTPELPRMPPNKGIEVNGQARKPKTWSCVMLLRLAAGRFKRVPCEAEGVANKTIARVDMSRKVELK